MKFKLTDMGKVMEAQLLAGSKPIITKIEASDAYSSNEGALLSVQNMKQELEIQEIAVIEGASHLKFVLHNVGLAEEYMLRQIGIYARQDEQAEEILYIIGQDKAGERVPASSEKLVEYEYDLMINTENTYEVQVNVKGSFFATKEELNETNVKVDGLLNPEFDDSGSVEGIKSFPDFLKTMVSRSSIFQFMRNAKAGFQFVLHAGQIVNNCVTDRADLPGSAAQLKVLMDLITKLNSDFNSHSRNVNDRLIRGNGYTALSVNGKEEGISHRLQINDSGIAAVYHSDSSGGNWSPDPIALKSDLQTIFPSKSYDTSIGTFVNFDDITQSQIASVFIGNDGSNKTPTGRDGILLVFNSQWTVQLFFDYAMEMLWRIKWGNWKQWERISSLPS